MSPTRKEGKTRGEKDEASKRIKLDTIRNVRDINKPDVQATTQDV